MEGRPDPTRDAAIIDVDGLARLCEALAAAGHEVLAPVVEGGVVVHRRIDGVDDLPRGRRSDQAPGRARLVTDEQDRFFAATPGADSWRQTFFPPRQTVLEATRDDDGRLHFLPGAPVVPSPPALLGVRACDLAALGVHDRVLGSQAEHPDDDYVARRADAVVVAVACTEPAATCFCASLGTGPAPGPGHDLALTEVLDDEGHRFLVRVGTERGRALLAQVPHRPADTATVDAAEAALDRAAAAMERELGPEGLRGHVTALERSARFAAVAERCLGCANCTLVCPTCFCHSIEDTTDLAGSVATRERVWASCFTDELSHLAGVGPVRGATASRYRQWLLHKLGTWWDQFDELGCVGCGRCITWCPVGIDITEEAGALLAEAASTVHGEAGVR